MLVHACAIFEWIRMFRQTSTRSTCRLRLLTVGRFQRLTTVNFRFIPFLSDVSRNLRTKARPKRQRYILAELGLHHAPYAPMHTHSECNIPTLQQEYKMYKRTKESTHVSELLGLLHLSLTFSAFSITNKQHNDSGSWCFYRINMLNRCKGLLQNTEDLL